MGEKTMFLQAETSKKSLDKLMTDTRMTLTEMREYEVQLMRYSVVISMSG